MSRIALISPRLPRLLQAAAAPASPGRGVKLGLVRRRGQDARRRCGRIGADRRIRRNCGQSALIRQRRRRGLDRGRRSCRRRRRRRRRRSCKRRTGGSRRIRPIRCTNGRRSRLSGRTPGLAEHRHREWTAAWRLRLDQHIVVFRHYPSQRLAEGQA